MDCGNEFVRRQVVGVSAKGVRQLGRGRVDAPERPGASSMTREGLRQLIPLLSMREGATHTTAETGMTQSPSRSTSCGGMLRQ